MIEPPGGPIPWAREPRETPAEQGPIVVDDTKFLITSDQDESDSSSDADHFLGTVPSRKRRLKKEIKQPRSSYILYQSHTRRLIRGEHPGKNSGEISKILSERWKNMTDAERSTWITMAKRDNERFHTEKNQLPRMPLNSWVLYSRDKRRELHEEMPGLTPCELQKVLAKRWKSLPADEKRVWVEAADRERARYHEEKREWAKRRVPSGAAAAAGAETMVQDDDA
jgi:hypothetical protein